MGTKLPRPISDDTERKGMGFDIPNGKYLVKVSNLEEREPAKGGDPYLAVELEILDAAREKGENAIGFKIFEQFSYSEKAEFRLVAFLDACYPPRFKGEEIPDDIDDGNVWLIVDARVEEYEGFERSRCRSFAPGVNWKGVDMKVDEKGEQIEVDKPSEKNETSSSKEGKDGDTDEVVM